MSIGASAQPQRRVERIRRSRRRRWPFLVAALAVAALGAGLWWQGRARAAATPTQQTVAVSEGSLAVTIDGSGSVQPASSLDLAFQSSGIVSEVLVKVGDQVAKGQPLARIDDRDLQLQVQQAEANLQTAQVKLEQTKSGNATPQDLAAARANLVSAQASLQQTRTGNTTVADLKSAAAAVQSAQIKLSQTINGNASAAEIAAAEANVRSAAAKLDAVKNPAPDKVTAAQTSLTQAQTSLEQTKGTAAANKERANQAMLQSADSVRMAQQAYSAAYWDNQQAQSGINPKTGNSFDDEKLDAAVQQRTYQAALDQAQLQLNQAQAALEQAKIAYESAKQQEITDIQQAEAQVRNAQAQLDAVMQPSQSDIAQAEAALVQAQTSLQQLKSGGTESDIALARTSLQQAQAAYDKLKQGATQAELAQAQAQVTSANASLEKLTAPATATDIEVAEANVTQAQASLDAAKLALEKATLTAPFAGVIGAVNVVPGSASGGSGSTAPLTLIDRSTLHIDLSLGETDVAKVEVGQPVEITLDALADVVLKGKVAAIAPTATVTQNVTTYPVTVTFDPGQTPIKLGMTANAAITTESVDGALLVPNRALQTVNGQKAVQVLYGTQQLPVSVAVTTGATNGTQTVVTGCVDSGSQCLKTGDKLLVSGTTGTTGTTGTANRQGGNFVGPGPGGPFP